MTTPTDTRTSDVEKEVAELIQNISELGVITALGGEEDVEPIFDFIDEVDVDGNRVPFSTYLETRLTLALTSFREKAVAEERERCLDAAWLYTVEATRLESWSKKEMKQHIEQSLKAIE